MIVTKQQKGLSLIELMVTLAISSLLMIGITQLYLDNKRNHAFQYNQSSNLDSSRYTSITLDSLISKAGYRRAAHQSLESTFKTRAADTDCSEFASGAVFTTLATTPEVGFCMRYEPAFSGEFDCQGTVSNLPTEDNKAFLSIPENSQIVLAIKYNPNNQSLECKSINSTTPAFVELVNGISDIRIVFGSSKKEHEVDQHTTASSWNKNNHGDIRTVQYEVLISSRPGQREGESSIFTQWLEKSDTTTKTRLRAADDRNLYQVSSNAPIARNLMP